MLEARPQTVWKSIRAETAVEMGEAAILPGVRRVDNTGLVDLTIDAGGRQHSRDLRCSLRPSWTACPDGRQSTDGRRRCPCAVESSKVIVASCSSESEGRSTAASGKPTMFHGDSRAHAREPAGPLATDVCVCGTGHASKTSAERRHRPPTHRSNFPLFPTLFS